MIICETLLNMLGKQYFKIFFLSTLWNDPLYFAILVIKSQPLFTKESVPTNKRNCDTLYWTYVLSLQFKQMLLNMKFDMCDQ